MHRVWVYVTTKEKEQETVNHLQKHFTKTFKQSQYNNVNFDDDNNRTIQVLDQQQFRDANQGESSAFGDSGDLRIGLQMPFG